MTICVLACYQDILTGSPYLRTLETSFLNLTLDIINDNKPESLPT